MVGQTDKKTIWNVPFTKKTNNADSAENFQIMNLTHKLKKIKRKRQENYKNIPLFETLTNDRVEPESLPPSQPFRPSPTKEFIHENKAKIHKIATSDTPVSDTYDYITRLFSYKGLDYFVPENYKKYVPRVLTTSFVETMGANYPSDYDCGEGVKCKDSANIGGVDAVDFIEYIYQEMLKINKNIAKAILRGMENGDNPADADVNLVAHHIAMMESLIPSCIFVYSWFYLMFYMKKDEVEPYDFSRNAIREKTNDYPLLSIFLFFFEFAIFFPEMLDKLLMHKIPTYFEFRFNPAFCFIILFGIIFSTMINSIVSIKDALISVFTGQVFGFFGIMQFIVFVVFIRSIITTFVDQGKLAASNMMSGDIFAGVRYYMSFNPFYFIMLFVYNLVRFILIMIVSVPAGVLFTTIYFLFYSLFAIPLYRGYNMFSIYSEINQFIINNSEFTAGGTPSYCRQDGFLMSIFKRCMSLFNCIIDILFLKFFTIMFILVISYSAFDYGMHLSHSDTLLAAKSLNVVMMFIMLIISTMVFLYNVVIDKTIITIVMNKMQEYMEAGFVMPEDIGDLIKPNIENKITRALAEEIRMKAENL